MNYWMNYGENKWTSFGRETNGVKKDLYELSYDLSIEEIDELLGILNKLLFERIWWSIYYQNIKCVIAKNQDLSKIKGWSDCKSIMN